MSANSARVGRVLAWVAALVIGPLSAAPALARPLSVRASSSIALDVMTDGAQVVVNGTLIEAPAGGLGGRTVWLTATPEDADEATLEVALVTGAEGRFRWDAVLDDGAWTLDAHYDGDAHRDPSDAARDVTLQRGVAAIEVRAPRLVPLTDGDHVEARVLVTNADARPVDRARVRLEGPCVPSALQTETNSLGVAVAPVAASEPGPCALVATLVDDGRYQPANGRTVIDVVTDPSLELTPQEVHGRWIGTGRWTITTTLRDGTRTIDGVPITLSAYDLQGDEVQRWEVSSGEGARVSPRSFGLAEAELRASVPLGTGALESPAVRISSANALARRLPWIGLGVLGLALSVVLAGTALAWWRDRPRATPKASSAPAPAPRVARESRRPRGVGVGGVVRDAETGRALSDVEVALTTPSRTFLTRSDEDGRFEIEEALKGQTAADIVLVFTAAHYMPWETRVHGAAPGELVTVHLTPIRAVVRERITRAFAQAAPRALDRQWWGRITVSRATSRVAQQVARLRHSRVPDPVATRELARLMSEAGATSDPALIAEALGALLDDVAFGPRAYDAQLLARVDTLVARLQGGRDG